MHGSIMMYLFIVPFAFGLANYIVPLQIGADGHGVPPPQRARLLVLPVRRAHDAVRASSPPTAPADFGWTAYAPLSDGRPLAGRRRPTCG